ncbi:MAG: hypothetical protein ACHQ0J_04910 [Candidatus Dormibacterales bacterium]
MGRLGRKGRHLVALVFALMLVAVAVTGTAWVVLAPDRQLVPCVILGHAGMCHSPILTGMIPCFRS